MWFGVLIVCLTPFLDARSCDVRFSRSFTTLEACKTSVEDMVKATEFPTLGFCVKPDGVEDASSAHRRRVQMGLQGEAL